MEPTKQNPGYGLTEADLQVLLSGSLKPEEIAGDPELQHKRVSELVSWFVRYVRGNANPKWASTHACELAYYIATTDAARHLNISVISQKAFMEGVNVTDDQRNMLKAIGRKEPKSES